VGKRNEAHISTIRRIEAYTHPSAPELDPPALQEPRQRMRAGRLRCQLFQHPGAGAVASAQSFLAFVASQGVKRVQEMPYSLGVRIYCLHGVPANNIASIRAHPAVEDLSLFPE
jgi:hypothetical protein